MHGDLLSRLGTCPNADIRPHLDGGVRTVPVGPSGTDWAGSHVEPARETHERRTGRQNRYCPRHRPVAMDMPSVAVRRRSAEDPPADGERAFRHEPCPEHRQN